MTLIKCPHCGHSVLSVASVCPTCNTTLGMTFLGPEHSGELTECRACGHTVRSASRVCPSCGVQAPGRRRGALPVILGISALLAVGAFIADRWPRPPATSPAVLGAEPPRESAAPLLATTPPPQADSQPATFKTKWTTLWVNVRQRPADNAPIVTVLRPGTRLETQARRYGWWLVFLDGDSLGYVAGALLSAREPRQSISTR